RRLRPLPRHQRAHRGRELRGAHPVLPPPHRRREQRRRSTMTVEGTWDISIKTLIGERKATVVLRMEGNALVPKERLLYDGAVKGDTVCGTTGVVDPMPLTLAFNGKVSGDPIAGKVSTASVPGASAERAVERRDQPSWIQVVLTWVNLSKACSDLSRPM